MKTRIITGVIMLMALIPLAIEQTRSVTLYALAIIFGSVAVYEMLSLKNKENKIPIPIVIISIISFLGVLLWGVNASFLSDFQSFFVDYSTVYIPIIVLLLLTPILFLKKYHVNDASFAILSVLYVGFGLNAVLNIFEYNYLYLLLIIFIVVTTDTFALIVGLSIGKHKLAPTISPKKSIEGAVGGVVFAVIVAILFYLIVDLDLSIGILIGLTIVMSIASQAGDLIASSFKRKYGVKDFGKIFPGHGGVLDRFDGLLFASFVSYIFIMIFVDLI